MKHSSLAAVENKVTNYLQFWVFNKPQAILRHISLFHVFELGHNADGVFICILGNLQFNSIHASDLANQENGKLIRTM